MTRGRRICQKMRPGSVFGCQMPFHSAAMDKLLGPMATAMSAVATRTNMGAKCLTLSG